MPTRAYDVVLYGATGFTGKQVARYLAERNPEPGLRWAIAARSASKLAAVAEELGIPDVPRLIADSHDPESLRQLAATTHVVLTTVGPYAQHGADMIAACIAEGTHYGDLTGETQFIRAMAQAHHDEAAAAGVRIVHCCGFDSIPSDIGVFTLQSAAIERFGEPLREIETLLVGGSAGISGGTIASMVNLIDDAANPEVRRGLGNPYSLVPGGSGPDTREQRGVRYSEAEGAWTAPFVMAAVNERVVRRSNALLDQRYGPDFRYGESMRTGPGLSGRLRALSITASLGGLMGALAVRPLRRLVVGPLLPKPGEGPSQEKIDQGWFKMRMHGRGPGDRALGLEILGKGDPGYGATACMLAESGICLARHPDLPRAGVLTPASAMGSVLAERLNATDVEFRLIPDPPGRESRRTGS